MTPEEKTFVLFNNRSIDHVMRFVDRSDPHRLASLEDKLAWVSAQYSEHRVVEIDASMVDETAPDVTYTAEDIAAAEGMVRIANEWLLEPTHVGDMGHGEERDWLLARGIPVEVMEKYCLGSLSSLPDDYLDVLGVSCHPALTKLLDASRGIGVIIPLFRDGKLVNCTTRRIDDLGKLKYTQAVPEVHVWGLESIRPGCRVYIAEGLFDMMALHCLGLCAVSVSSAMWSGPQLLALLKALDHNHVHIVADNDSPGLRCAEILRRVIEMHGVHARTVRCVVGKDPAEMYFERYRAEFEEVRITREMIASADDTSFNFTDYLKNREF